MNTKKTKTTQTIGEAKLPIDGDATAQMEDNNVNNNSLTVDPRLVFSKDYMKGYTKPYWWIPLGMPIWISIALKGSNGLNERLTALESDQYRSSSPVNNISDGLSSSSPNSNNNNENGGNGSTAATTMTTNYVVTSSSSTSTNVNATAITITTSDKDETSTVVPCIIDYGFAIFFIVFGCIALVAGVASNVYVQMRGMYIAQ